MIRSIPNNAVAVTPSNTVDLANVGVLWVGNGGTVKVITEAGDTVIFGNVPDGTALPLLVKRVFATGTSATNLNLLYDV